MGRLSLLVATFLIGLSGVSNGSDASEKPDYLISVFSSGKTAPDLPLVSVLHDRTNQTILRACSVGASLEALASLGVDSLEQRLDRMCKGKVLRRPDSVYLPMAAFFTGARRERLDSIAGSCASKMADSVEVLLNDMRASDFVRPAGLFHLLWSLVIDESWGSIWGRLKLPEGGLPRAVWIVDPPHEFTVGTNYWQLPAGSSVAATWSPHFRDHLDSLESLRLEHLYAAWEMPVKDSAAEALLRRCGLVGDDERYRGLTYRDSTPFAAKRDEWVGRYSDQVARSLDLKAAAKALGVSEGQTFVILLHEVAYELFKRLAHTGALDFPEILKTGRPVDETVNVVSLELVRLPTQEDAAMALWMKSDYHGTDEVVNAMKEVLVADPDNLTMRLLRGMSLYDLGRYDEATSEFQELSARAAGKPEAKRLYDWSRIWLGHVCDAQGDRAKALEWYRVVANDGSPNSRMSFGQYEIEDIDAISWAKQRLQSPFRQQ